MLVFSPQGTVLGKTTKCPFSLGVIGIALFGANFNLVTDVGLP